MSYGTGKSRENYSSLLRVGATMYSRPVYDTEVKKEAAKTKTEKLLDMRNVKPVELALHGLTRAYAVILYRALDRNLNPLTSRQKDILALARMDETTLASIEREPIGLQTDVDSEVDIELTEAEPGAGRFDIDVRQGLISEDDPLTFSRTVHIALDSVMAEVDLTQPKDMLKQLFAGKAEEINGTASRRFSYKNRLLQDFKVKGLQKGETQFNEDLKEIRLLMHIFGVEDAEDINPIDLVRFWGERGRDHLDVVDLYLFTLTRAQEVNRAPGSHYKLNFNDLRVYGAHETPTVLESTSKRQTSEVMTVKGGGFGLFKDKADDIQAMASLPIDRVRLRYLTWIATNPDLVNVRREARNTFRPAIVSYDQLSSILQRIYRAAESEIEDEIDRHEKSISKDAWSTFGEIEYSRDIPIERDAYNLRLNFLQTAWILGKYLFTTEKIDEAFQKRLH